MRVVQILPAHLTPELYCVPLPDAPGFGDMPADPARRVRARALPDGRRSAHKAMDRAAMRARLARELAAAGDSHQFSLIVVVAEGANAGACEALLSAVFVVMGMSLSEGDAFGRLSDDAAGVILSHAGPAQASGVFQRLAGRLYNCAGAWRARCLVYPADRAEIARWL